MTELNWLEITDINFGYLKGDSGGELRVNFSDNINYMVGGKLEVYKVAV